MTRTHTTPFPLTESPRDGHTKNMQAKLPCPHPSASFWHSEPTPFLLQHRTTPELPPSADIVIIGGGITGVSIARYLSEDSRSQSLSVVLLEAREICSGATGRNGGHCKADLLERTPEIAAFEMRNVETVQSYIQQNDVQCEWETVNGCLTYWNDELFRQAKKRLADLNKLAPDLAALIDVSQDKNVMEQHRVRPECVGMMTTRHNGQLWPYKYVAFITEKLIKQGSLNVQTNTPVIRITSQPKPSTSTPNPPDIQTIHTPRGQITTKNIIIATNGYTSNLLPHFTDLIVPIRCQMSALHPPPNSPRLSNSYGMVGFQTSNPETDDYLIQRPFHHIDGQCIGGHLMYGGGRSFAAYETVGESDDDVVDPGEVGYLTGALTRMLDLGGGEGEGGELVASHLWTGIKGGSRDGVPWVGRVPVAVGGREWLPGVWLCAGYSGHGMPNATLCAKAVVEMVLGGEEGYEDVAGLLVRSGGLPWPYVITWERIEAARRMPVVGGLEAAVS